MTLHQTSMWSHPLTTTKKTNVVTDAEFKAVTEEVMDVVVAEVIELNILSATTVKKTATLRTIPGQSVEVPEVKVCDNRMMMKLISKEGGNQRIRHPSR